MFALNPLTALRIWDMWPETQEIHLEFGNPTIAEAQIGPTSEIAGSQERAPHKASY